MESAARISDLQRQLDVERAHFRSLIVSNAGAARTKNLGAKVVQQVRMGSTAQEPFRKGSLAGRLVDGLIKRGQPTGHLDLAKDVGEDPEKVRNALWYLQRREHVKDTGRDKWIAIQKPPP